MNEYNQHYIAYAQAHGKTPDDMMGYDVATWPGGCMCGFLLWISSRKQEFWDEQPQAFVDRYTIHDHNAWTVFLQSYADKVKPC